MIALYAVLPGAWQLTEQALHLVTEGHTAHAIDDGEHEPDGAEHGCSGSFHMCSCHHSPSFLAVSPAAIATPDPAGAEAPLEPGGDAPEAYRPGLLRPPIARG